MDASVGDAVSGKCVTDILTGVTRVGARRQVVVDYDHATLSIQCLREIPRLLLSGRDGSKKLIRAALTDRFVIRKEECTVANDASAESRAILVTNEESAFH